MSSIAARKNLAAGLPTTSAFTSQANYRAEIIKRQKQAMIEKMMMIEM